MLWQYMLPAGWPGWGSLAQAVVQSQAPIGLCDLTVRAIGALILLSCIGGVLSKK